MTAMGGVQGSIRFEGWDMFPMERRVRVNGREVAVGGRAFDLLLALAGRPGQLLDKRTLMDAAWPGLVVEENNLSVQIAALRKVLGPEMIATVAGRGYRLCATPLTPHRDGGALMAEEPPAASARTGHEGLIGRDADIDALCERLSGYPVVTIVGPGGIGKTSLAREVSRHFGHRWPDGVVWIDLAPLREESQFLHLVGKAMGVSLDDLAHAQEDLVTAISSLHALVVLDNCEHLVGCVAAFIEETLRNALGLSWLVTSQAPLRLLGESVYRLEPLALPPAGMALQEALGYGALALLHRRAAAADRHFVLDAPQLPMAVDLCRQLDGLPLAIELAAARVASLGLAAVHRQLGERLQLLALPRRGNARHHSLRSTLDWSHSLLSLQEQRVFRRLQPFVGSFGLDMARALVAEAPGEEAMDALVVLGSLVEKSLVQREAAHAQRFSLLGSARDYAASQLAAAGETDRMQRRHAEVVADWFDAIRGAQGDMRDDEWLALCRPERDNVRSALAWACRAGEPDLLARLVRAAAEMEALTHHVAELARWDIPLHALATASPSLRAAACLELSWAHYADGSRETGTELALRALADHRECQDAVGIYRALAQLIRLYESRPGQLASAEAAWAELQRMDTQAVPLRTRLATSISAGFFYERGRSIERLVELEELARRAGFDTLASVCRVQQTDQLLVQQRFEEAVRAVNVSLDAGEPPGRARALMLLNAAMALIQLGRSGQAYAPAIAAVRMLPSTTYVVVDAFALAAVREGRLAESALMAGYGARVRRERDEQADPAEAAMIDETCRRLAAELPPDRLLELLQMGAGMSAGQAMALLAQEYGGAADPAAAEFSPAPPTAEPAAAETDRWS